MITSPFSPEDLKEWRRPGFTPGLKHVPRLVSGLALASEDEAVVLEKALLRAHEASPDPVITLIRDALFASLRPARGRLTRLLGRIAVSRRRQDLEETLITLTLDGDLKTALNAVAALGQLPGPGSEAALLALWDRGPRDLRPEMRRALIRSLGKVGGVGAVRAFSGYEPDETDREERRLLAQARLILERDTARTNPSSLREVLGPPPHGSLILHCRRGLEGFVLEEIRDLERPSAQDAVSSQNGSRDLGRSRVAGLTVVPGRILVEDSQKLLGPWGWMPGMNRILCAERWAFLLGGQVQALARSGRVAEALTQALQDASLKDWLQRSTDGPVRYRVDWPEATRSQIWSLAETLHQKVPDLVNDPTESLWEFGVIAADSGKPAGTVGRLIELRAKGLVDQRFAYRDSAVPASSHAPLAAALARLGGVRGDDLVWDPFCGAGTELIERARLGPYGSLWGTDLDPEALRCARDNLTRAGIEAATLEIGDACHWRTVRPTLIITNPPLGRRVARGDARQLLHTAAVHFAAQLAPGGRLVWVSPFPRETRAALERAGLKVTFGKMVDMGGFDAEMQRADKP